MLGFSFLMVIKAVNVAYGNSFSNQWAFTVLENEVFKYNFYNFYTANTIPCILLKFAHINGN